MCRNSLYISSLDDERPLCKFDPINKDHYMVGSWRPKARLHSSYTPSIRRPFVIRVNDRLLLMVHQMTTIRFDIVYLHHVSLVPLPVQPVTHG